LPAPPKDNLYRRNHLDLADMVLRLFDGAKSDEAQPLVESDGARVAIGHHQRNRLVPGSSVTQEITNDGRSHATSLHLRQQRYHAELDAVGPLQHAEVPDVTALELDYRIEFGPELITHRCSFGGIVPPAELADKATKVDLVESVAELEIVDICGAERVCHGLLTLLANGKG
jgi:hypothetical protein